MLCNQFCQQLSQALQFQARLELSLHELQRLEQTLCEFRNLYERSGESSFLRSHSPAHFTASACLVCLPQRAILLTRHKKLGKWLQLGGHIDPGETPAAAALRECSEESGLSEALIRPLDHVTAGIPIDADIHSIPESQSEAAHDHFDLRYAFLTTQPQQIQSSIESEELAWVPLSSVSKYSSEESLLRIVRILENYLSRQAQTSA